MEATLNTPETMDQSSHPAATLPIPLAANKARLSPVEILRLMDTSLGATVSVVDRELRFRYVNAGFAQAFDLDWKDLIGRSIRDVYPAVDFEKFLPYLTRALAGESVTYERLGRIHQRENIWRTVSMNPWRDVNGAVIGIVHCSLAVHELKTATEALQVANERLRILALHDQLTGLSNRNAMSERLAVALTRATRTQETVAILFLDLDGFKQVNDNFGHAAGDAVLCEVAQRLQLAVRATDVVARFGGDEFVVLLEAEVRDDTPTLVCERIFALLQAPCVFQHGVERASAMISASIGIAKHPPLPNRADDLLRRADAAMFAAKRAGKACVRVAG